MQSFHSFWPYFFAAFMLTAVNHPALAQQSTNLQRVRHQISKARAEIRKVRAELKRIDVDIAKYEAMRAKHSSRTSERSRHAVRLCAMMLSNLRQLKVALRVQLSNLQMMLRNLLRLQKNLRRRRATKRQIRHNSRKLGPIGYKIPVAVTGACRKQLGRFFIRARMLWQNVHFSPKTKGKLQDRGMIIDNVASSLQLLRMIKAHGHCFNKHASLPPQRKRCVALARKVLRRRGLKVRVLRMCKRLQAFKRRCLATRTNPIDQLDCDVAGRAFTCSRPYMQSWMHRR